MDDIIDKTYEVVCAGEAVLEYLFFLPDQDLWIMAHYNVCEMIAFSAEYLWWERQNTQGDNSESLSYLYGGTSSYGKLCYCHISKGLYEEGG